MSSQSDTSRLAWFKAVAFALLLIGTVAAFLLAQRLKTGPTLVQQLRATPVVSPNGDGRKDGAVVSFLVSRRARVTVSIRSAASDRVVATLARRRNVRGYRQVRFRWDGRSSVGRRLPDGRYRIDVRVGRRELDSVRTIVLDTEAPAVSLLRVGSSGREVRFRLITPGRRREVRLFRRRGGRRGWVLVGEPRVLRFGTTRFVQSVPRSPGPFLVVASSRDIAGNIGHSVRWQRRTSSPNSVVPSNVLPAPA